MAFTVSTAGRNTQLDALATLIEGGAGDSNLVFQSNTDTDLCSLILPTTFPAAATGTLDMTNATTLSGTVGTAGTIDRFEIRDGDGTVVLDGGQDSVSTSGADINLSSLTVAVSETIEVSTLDLTAPSASA